MSSGLRRLAGFLPAGHPLSESDWALRHRVIMWVLLLHTVGVPLYGLAQHGGLLAPLLKAAPLWLTWWLAGRSRFSRRTRACLATFGLLTASAVLVEMSGGLIEMHFHFFVMLFVITFYQDWATFLLAVLYVLIDHGVVGTLAPRSLYDHVQAQQHPFTWAGVHALFIAAAAAAAVVNWRLAEGAEETARRLHEQLVIQATHDPLTGTLNRREFERVVAQAQQRAGKDGTEHAVWVFDLDRFKIVNDTSGHAAGDALLRQLTRLIVGSLPDTAQLARLGGDEFGVLLTDCSLTEAAAAAETVRRAVARYRFGWERHTFMIGVSIGVVPLTAVEGTAEELLKAADAACYAAKDAGRDRVHVYQLDDGALVEQHGNSQWASRIMAAIEEDRFELHYQPIVPLAAGAGAGSFGELLLRLREEDGTLAYPGAFMPAAERYELMPGIDRWVLATALATIGSAYRAGVIQADDIYSINLSGASVGDETFLPLVRTLLAEQQMPARLICLEITESVAIRDLDVAIRFINELRTVGCRFALDDFGKGLSSFTYLKQLPVDFLKIEGAFVRGMLDDPVDRSMVEAVNQIGQGMGLRTIAEFVETEALVVCLRELGVDYAQGYATGRPAPLRDHLSGRLETVGHRPVALAAAPPRTGAAAG
ncbi:MAG TPA: EAL domain-containing protein [Mycobacteriales bacterium]|nr:EAL domain-containing protein [Mycobacteriales bacterium]